MSGVFTAIAEVLGAVRRHSQLPLNIGYLLITTGFSIYLIYLGASLLHPWQTDHKRITLQVLSPVASGQAQPSPYQILSEALRKALEQRANKPGGWTFSDGASKVTIAVAPSLTPVSGSLAAIAELDHEEDSDNDDIIQRIAIVQSDVLYHYVHGGHPQLLLPRKKSFVRAVARMLPEWLFVYRTKSSEIQALGKAERICAGSPEKLPYGTGHLFTAINIMRATGSGAKYDLFSCPGSLDAVGSYDYRLQVRSPPGEAKGNEEIVGLRGDLATSLSKSYENLYQLVSADQLKKECPGCDEDRASVQLEGILITTQSVALQIVDQLITELSRLDTACRNQDPSDVVRETHFCDLASGTGQKNERLWYLPISQHSSVTIERLDEWLSRMVAKTELSLFQGVVYLLVGGLLLATIRNLSQKVSGMRF